MSKKTNIDYLRHILNTLGNLMGENNYKESIEWLDAIQEELVASKNRMTDMEDEITVLENNIDELKNELREAEEEPEYANEIDAGIGYIKYDADALPLQSLMETLDEKLNLKKISPLKIENLLNAL